MHNWYKKKKKNVVYWAKSGNFRKTTWWGQCVWVAERVWHRTNNNIWLEKKQTKNSEFLCGMWILRNEFLDWNSFEPIIHNDTDKELLKIIKEAVCCITRAWSSFSSPVLKEELCNMCPSIFTDDVDEVKSQKRSHGITNIIKYVINSNFLSKLNKDYFQNSLTHHSPHQPNERQLQAREYWTSRNSDNPGCNINYFWNRNRCSHKRRLSSCIK